MNICTRCGAEQPPHAQFCGSCGYFFSTNSSQSPSSSALYYVTAESKPPFPVKQTSTSNSAYETLLDKAQTSQTPLTPLPEQRAFDGTPFYGNTELEEEQEDERGLLFLPPVQQQATPMVSQTPQISGGPMLHNTPQIGNVPSAPQVSPSVNQNMGVQQQVLRAKKPALRLKPLRHQHTRFEPIHATYPHTSHKHAPRIGKKTRPHVLIITFFLIALIILGTLLTLVFVTPPSLALIGGGNVGYGASLHLHGNWYTPGSNVLLLLDETVPLSAQQPTLPPTTHGQADYTRLNASPLFSHGSTSGNSIIVGITGSFDATIVVGADWKTGKHTIRALEQGGKRSAVIEVTVSTPAHLDSITPATIALGPVTEGDTKLVSSQITIGTVGAGSVAWTSSWDHNAAPWLQLDHSSDQIQAPNTQDIMITADPQKLKAGSYNTTITFTDTSGSKNFSLPVSLTIQPNKTTTPTLSSVNPNTLVFDAIPTGSTRAVTQPLTLSTAGKGKVQWQATWDKNADAWLQLDRSADTIQAPDSQQATVSVQPQGLIAGQYTATMTFTSPQSSKPLIVTVNITVQGQADLSSVSPNSVSLGPVTEGYTQPPTAQVTLNTSGTGNVQWQASWNKSSSPWLQLDRTSDQIQAPATETIVVGAVIGMKAGVYTTNVSFTNPQTGSSISLAINFTVQATTAVPGEISSVTPATVTLGPVTAGYQKIASTQVTLNTSGTGTVAWNVSYDKNQGYWLTLPTSGQIQAPGSQSITLSTTTGVKAGTYTTNVSFINPQSNKTLTLAVTFIVRALPPAWGGVSPNQLTLPTVTQGYPQPVSAQATLSTTGSGTLLWTANSNATWLSLDNASGQIQAPGTQSVTVSAATGLQAGSYSGNITFTDTQSGRQLILTVTISVQPPPTLGINTNTLTVNTDCSARRTGWICFVTLTNQSTTDNLTWSSASTTSGTTSLIVIPSTNTLTAGQSQRVQISVIIQQSGAFTDTVTFTGPGNSQVVQINYTPPPVIG